MKFLIDFVWRCKTLIIPLALIILTTIILYMMGHKDIAQIVSAFGIVLVIFGNIFWILFFHSRKRWPKVNWWKRLMFVLTFKK